MCLRPLPFGLSALLFSAAACGPPPVPAPPPPPPAPPVVAPNAPAPAPVPAAAPVARPFAELAVATEASLLAALRAHDEAGLAACYAPDARIWLGPGVDVYGPSEIEAFAKAAWAAFPDAKLQWSTFLRSGRSAALELAWTGSQSGRLGDIPPSKRVLGSHALIVERFAPSGLLASQHVYFDADALRTELVRVAMPRGFEGLPTTQASVVDEPGSEEEEALKRTLMTSFAHGAFDAAPPLASESFAWTDATKERTVTGKGAIRAWTSFLEHSFKGGGPELVDRWTTGQWIVLEWSSSPSDASTANASRAAELVRLDGGRIREVRTYRSSAWGGGLGAKPRAKNQ